MFILVYANLISSRKQNYGIELELNNFAILEQGKGFKADFTLNKNVNYSSFKLIMQGRNNEGDRLIFNLNNEFSASSSQKRGNTFTIIYECNPWHFTFGKYYFLLDDQSGENYRSNFFTRDLRGNFKILKSIGKPVPEKKQLGFFEKFKYYVFAGLFVVGIFFIYFLIKMLRPKKEALSFV
ncbi:hypothetical protein GVAV_003080 [Gurleya vavrai]